MSVLLVHIPVGFEESYPLGLAAIAAPLIKAGFSVEGVDVGRVGISGLSERLKRGDIDVVGLGIWTPGVDQARDVVSAIRAAPNAPTVVTGGPHASLRPNDVDMDCAVIGEGEQAFLDVVQALASKRSLSGLAGVQCGRNSDYVPREWMDLGDFPLPDRTVFKITDYHREHMPKKKRFASAYTSRGCRHHCSYCSTPKLWGQLHRYRPAEQVVAEWRQLRVDHGVDGILVEDDLFTHDKDRVAELCEQLIRKAPGVTWELLNGVRPDSVDPDLLSMMARAGCTRIAFGIETAGAKSLKRMGRTPDMAKVADLVRSAADVGLSTTGYFMIGLPGETESDRNEMFDWAINLPLDFAHFCQASAWPGTRWTPEELTPLPPKVRAMLYAKYYLHPGRARRLMRAMNLSWISIIDLARRWIRWVQQPIESKGNTR